MDTAENYILRDIRRQLESDPDRSLGERVRRTITGPQRTVQARALIRLIHSLMAQRGEVAIQGAWHDEFVDGDRWGLIADEFTAAHLSGSSFRLLNDPAEVAGWDAPIFAETTWRGPANNFRGRFSVGSLQDTTLLRVLNRLPTVVWNKEDPSNFLHFLPLLGASKTVLTIDSNLIPLYRALGIDAGFQSFFYNPELVNPFSVSRHIDSPSFVFSGSLRRSKYPSRAERILSSLDSLRSVGADVQVIMRTPAEFDSKDLRSFRVKSNVKYLDALELEGEARCVISASSPPPQSKMVPRRVIEASARGQILLTSPSEGVRENFGDSPLVFGIDEPLSAANLHSRLASDPEAFEHSWVFRAIRASLQRDTREVLVDRLHEMVGIPAVPRRRILLACIASGDEWLGVLKNLSHQLRQPDGILIINDERVSNLHPVIQSYADQQGISLYGFVNDLEMALNDHDAVSVFDANCRYGPNYMRDYELYLQYTHLSSFGKGMYFVQDPEKQGDLWIEKLSDQWSLNSSVNWKTLMVRAPQVAKETVGEVDLAGYFREVARQARSASIDAYNFVDHGPRMRDIGGAKVLPSKHKGYADIDV